MRFLFAIPLVLFAVSAGAEVKHIDNDELARLVASGAPIVDIRTAVEWKETGVLAGSHLITFFDERGRSDPPGWLEKLSGVAKPGEPIILICRTGNRTRVVAEFLDRQTGYKNVYNVKAGIYGWTRAGRPVVPAPLARASCPAGAKC